MSTSAEIIETDVARQGLARAHTRDEQVERETTCDGLTGFFVDISLRMAALRSFLVISNHPYSDTEREQIKTRDFVNEVRLLRDELLLCTELLLTFSSEQFRSDASQTEDTEILTPPSHLRRELFNSAQPGEFVRNLETLSSLCAALIDVGSVSFQSWKSLCTLAGQEIERNINDETRNNYHHPAPSNIPAQLAALTKKISPDSLAADVSSIFSRLFQMLAQLNRVQGLLTPHAPLKQALPIFTLLREQSSSLLELIRNRTLNIEGLDLALHEQIDGLAYAMRMELRKAFEYELVGFHTLRNPQHLYAKVENTHGILKDCFQQSIISLATTFAPQLEAKSLFYSFQTKLEQSLLLRKELWTVLKVAQRASDLRDEKASRTLIERLTSFREGGLRFLMYKDWEALERFTEELIVARSSSNIPPILNRLQAFLETLFSQVNMRAVLSAHPFHPLQQED